jgi:cytochrome bd-type quinol oxidase subunit 1
MQTPQGFIIENGHLIPQDWLAIIFNPFSVSLVPYGDSRVSQ